MQREVTFPASLGARPSSKAALQSFDLSITGVIHCVEPPPTSGNRLRRPTARPVMVVSRGLIEDGQQRYRRSRVDANKLAKDWVTGRWTLTPEQKGRRYRQLLTEKGGPTRARLALERHDRDHRHLAYHLGAVRQIAVAGRGLGKATFERGAVRADAANSHLTDPSVPCYRSDLQLQSLSAFRRAFVSEPSSVTVG
jgi:hypothetical protein